MKPQQNNSRHCVCVCVSEQVCSVSTLSRNVIVALQLPSLSSRRWPSLLLAGVSTICGLVVQVSPRRRSVYSGRCLVYAACTLSGICASSPSCAVSASTSSIGCLCRRASRNTSSRVAAVVVVSLPWRHWPLGAILSPRYAGLRASTASAIGNLPLVYTAV